MLPSDVAGGKNIKTLEQLGQGKTPQSALKSCETQYMRRERPSEQMGEAEQKQGKRDPKYHERGNRKEALTHEPMKK